MIGIWLAWIYMLVLSLRVLKIVHFGVFKLYMKSKI